MTQKKIDRFLWVVVKLFPIMIYLIMCINNSSMNTFNVFMSSQTFVWAFIFNIFTDVFKTAFGSYVWALGSIVSYWVAVDVIHCFFDVVVFIPRFAHTLIDKFTKEDAIK